MVCTQTIEVSESKRSSLFQKFFHCVLSVPESTDYSSHIVFYMEVSNGGIRFFFLGIFHSKPSVNWATPMTFLGGLPLPGRFKELINRAGEKARQPMVSCRGWNHISGTMGWVCWNLGFHGIIFPMKIMSSLGVFLLIVWDTCIWYHDVSYGSPSPQGLTGCMINGPRGPEFQVQAMGVVESPALQKAVCWIKEAQHSVGFWCFWCMFKKNIYPHYIYPHDVHTMSTLSPQRIRRNIMVTAARSRPLKWKMRPESPDLPSCEGEQSWRRYADSYPPGGCYVRVMYN